MDTNTKIFNSINGLTSPEDILSSGEYFSGSILLGYEGNKSVIFNLVNKETMQYILSDIKFNDEVSFEIFSYARNTGQVQLKSDWDRIDQG
jgi:hypothetical protein